MDETLRRLLAGRDDIGIERAFFEGTCPHFVRADWRDDDVAIVEDFANRLGLPSLTAEARGHTLIIRFGNREIKIPLTMDVGDRHATVCALNDLLSPDYEIRFVVCSHGGDTVGFTALSLNDWRQLESESPAAVAENFVDPRILPNIMTELVGRNLPELALARFNRMLNRNKRG